MIFFEFLKLTIFRNRAIGNAGWVYLRYLNMGENNTGPKKLRSSDGKIRVKNWAIRLNLP